MRLFLNLLPLIGAAAIWLATNHSYLAEYAMSENGRAMTAPTDRVDTVKIAPAKGEDTIGMLAIGNPAGYRTPHAVKAGTIDVEFELASLTGDAVVIRGITQRELGVVVTGALKARLASAASIDKLAKVAGAPFNPQHGAHDGRSGRKLGHHPGQSHECHRREL